MNDVVHPFLKWPGGKQWLLNKITFPKRYNTYYEPFLGGGSVFFHLNPKSAVISDVNIDLINLYCIMRDYPIQLKEKMIIHNRLHCVDYYYRIRESSPDNYLDRAARFLYLNRTCFNGMYRVNNKGGFNVPIGSKTDCLYDINLFSTYSEILQNKIICVGDFSHFIDMANQNDFVFCDPPYRTMKDQNQFIKYNNRLFSWNDQLRLLDALKRAKDRGVRILSTNVNSNDVKKLYLDSGFFVISISKYSSISGKSFGRGQTEELVISSFRIGRLNNV